MLNMSPLLPNTSLIGIPDFLMISPTPLFFLLLSHQWLILFPLTLFLLLLLLHFLTEDPALINFDVVLTSDVVGDSVGATPNIVDENIHSQPLFGTDSRSCLAERSSSTGSDSRSCLAERCSTMGLSCSVAAALVDSSSSCT